MGAGIKMVANNKKAYHDYFIDDKFEARDRAYSVPRSNRSAWVKCSIKEAFITDRERWSGVCISACISARMRREISLIKIRCVCGKLLLHKLEIRRLMSKIKEKGYTLVPLQVYFKGSLVKVEIGLARGKKLYDKRDDLAKKDAKREI